MNSSSAWPQETANVQSTAGNTGRGDSALHGASSSAMNVTTTRRLLIKRDHNLWPFVWRGLLPLLGLLGITAYAVGPFARQAIERRVTNEVRSALDLRQHGWAKLDVSGQNVRLSGIQPKAGAGDEAIKIASEATCPTWTGRRTCAVSVQGVFQEAPQAPAPAPAPAPVVAAPPPPTVVEQAQACEAALAKLLGESRIQFQTAKAVISPSSHMLLDQLARAAKTCPGVIRVEGHTDDVGSAASNLALSMARAKAVRDALIERGISASQLTAQGYGLSKPAVPNNSEDNRAINRRIEFKAAADDATGAKK